MNYVKLKKNAIANGEGVRTNLFVAGCGLQCPGCFNYMIQKHTAGQEFTEHTLYEIFESMQPHVAGLSILGGDPTDPRNIETVADICQLFKERFPDKTIWVWSGYILDLNLNDGTGQPVYSSLKFADDPRLYYGRLLQYIDVLVDGKWDRTKADKTLLWAGSSNQRVIDVQRTLAAGEVVLYSDNRTPHQVAYTR